MTPPRIGFACQYKHPERLLSASALKLIEGPFNPRTTTLRWMDGVTPKWAVTSWLKSSRITCTNDYALQFLDRFDIMLEAKDKNVASLAFYEHMKRRSA